MDSINAALFAVFTACIGLWIWRRYQKFNHFKYLGIPGPQPSFWFGNLTEYISKGPIRAFQDWGKAYGSFYGFYFGVTPLIVTSDLDLIKRITITEFRNFSNRSAMIPEVSNKFGDTIKETMSIQTGQVWKERRRIISHLFSPAQMKMMAKSTEAILDRFLKEDLKEKVEDMNPILRTLGLTILLKTIYGLETKPKGPLEKGLQTVSDNMFFSGASNTLFSFPESAWIFSLITRFFEWYGSLTGVSTGYELIEIGQEILSQRKANPQVSGYRKDLIQIMLDHQNEEAAPSDEKTPPLTDTEIIATAIDFMFAGLDTVGLALNTTLFHLALDQGYQDVCRQEVLNCKDFTSYNELSKLTFLDGVIKEALRLYPSVGIVFNRVAEFEFTHQQWTIPKGSVIVFPMGMIHRDPDIWEDPESFDPQRHLNVKDELFSFGVGPRNCIASRLAPMLLKQALGRMLATFQFKVPPGSPKILELEYGIFNAKVKYPIQMEVTPLKK